MNIKQIYLSIFFSLFFYTYPFYFSIGQNEEVKDMFEMSLSELMDMNVTVASKTSESINDAPGIITVISRKEIESFAASNLGEILNRVVSSSFLSANILQNNLIDFRAQSFTPYNNHSLFLVNGRPVRDPITGGLNATILTSFPITSIERIEIIRGPGSVLYGSCAFSGVVNIITRELKENGTVSDIEFKYGSLNTYEFNATASIKNDDLIASLSFINAYSDGEEFRFTDYLGVDSSANFWKKNMGMHVNIDYKGLSLNTGILDYRPYSLGGVDNSWSPDWGDKEQHISYYSDLGYRFSIGEKSFFQTNITSNRHIWHTDYGKIMEADDIFGEISFQSNLYKNFNILIGGTWGLGEHKSDYFFDGRSYFGSLYLQADYKIYDKLKLIVGGQFNKIRNINGNFSPRIGLIANINENFGIKALYGQAFRKGYPLETSFNIPQLLGNDKLMPELINTFEIQAFYTSEKIQLSLTGYYSNMTDIIYRDAYDTTHIDWVKYFNGQSHRFWGIEFESKMNFTDNLHCLFSANYQTNENQNGVVNSSLHPNYMFKGGLIYSKEKLNIGVFNSYFGRPSDVSVINPDVINYNPAPKEYNLLSAKISYDISRLFQNRLSVKLALEGQNLLGQDIRYPEFTTKGINSLLPLKTERLITGSISIKF